MQYVCVCVCVEIHIFIHNGGLTPKNSHKPALKILFYFNVPLEVHLDLSFIPAVLHVYFESV